MLKGFFLQNPPTRKRAKKGRFFGGNKTEKRDVHSFTESCIQRKNTQKKRKVNEKGGKDSLEKNAHQKKGENKRTEKHTEDNEKGGKERVKRRFLQRKNFLFHKTFFKKKKRQVKIQKRISQNIEKRK